uniref:Uncharacterized protein n=1 Tax=Oryza sativa subsp. japonica TaxID=39947 RepID=Q654A5_ORYSJ|nr:hypothetical protein [Oryza sativa Japonica Group]
MEAERVAGSGRQSSPAQVAVQVEAAEERCRCVLLPCRHKTSFSSLTFCVALPALVHLTSACLSDFDLAIPSSPDTPTATTAAMEGAVLCAANHAPLTPITFLDRAALVYPDRPAIVASSSGLTRTYTACSRPRAAAAVLSRNGPAHDPSVTAMIPSTSSC